MWIMLIRKGRSIIVTAAKSIPPARIIIQALEDKAKKLGAAKVKLDGQLQAQGFYEKLGYEVKSGIFLDAGIEHVLMVKEV